MRPQRKAGGGDGRTGDQLPTRQPVAASAFVVSPIRCHHFTVTVPSTVLRSP